MKKLYKRIDDDWFYAECWMSGGTAVTHWGVVGNNGRTKSEPCTDEEYPQYEITFSQKLQKQGYLPRERTPQFTVILQLEIKDIQLAMQIKDNLTDALNNELGWVGLGHVDGYDVDAKKRLFQKSYLRIFCFVVSMEIAKPLINSIADKSGAAKYSVIT